jgi:FKBP-type peptidyl-prolyl cis-trans isomerase
MKTLVKLVLVTLFTASIFSCQNNDDSTSLDKPRPYAEVYLEDTLKIRQFMESHYVTVDSDYNTTFTQIPAGGTQTPISEMSNLEHIERNVHDITYKIYFLKLREGSGERTTPVDSTFVSYKGTTFAKTTTNNIVTYTQSVFDQSQTPVWFTLEDVIRGWGEVIPQFKTGTNSVVDPDGTVTFENYGAGVMFLPSGLAYYNSSTTNISAYSPLIFNFKLYNQMSRDHDRDGILSRIEYGPDFNVAALDTDGDKISNYRDVDDDGDGVLTIVETKKPLPLSSGQGTSLNYPYDPITDNPATPENESEPKGIPSASGDGITPTRLRRHLDKNSKPPFIVY